VPVAEAPEGPPDGRAAEHWASVTGMSGALQFGFFPEPQTAQLPDLVRRVQWADRNGLDLIGIQDHPYQRRFADTFVLLAHLAAVTQRVRFFPDVASLPLRGPALLAKQSATIDLLSGGRFELGIGAGGFSEAIAGLGGPRRTPGEALQALREAIGIIRALWTDDRGLRITGEHYRLAGAHGGPRPAHDIEIWVGGYGPRMLRLIGETAEGWVPSMAFLPPAALAERGQLLDEAAAEAGRDPRSIRRIYNISGTIQDAVEPSEKAITGPPTYWRDRLLDLAQAHRIDGFVLWPAGDIDEQLARFALDVVPAVREAE
jgi:alkanesulfonate monooxygenase SsuD/methylene tetrahydromethanopterin reductase-like flavin-dependent oxidoreductase (luciferase family)